MIFPIIFLLALGFWIYAERHLGIAPRIGGGVACIVFVGCTCYYLASIIPSYERTFHRSSMKLTGELMATGATERVQQAVETYNRYASTGSTYTASMRMWSVLNHGKEK